MIGSGTARTILFARMDCRHFVMTLPDLGKLWLKRSVHPVALRLPLPLDEQHAHVVPDAAHSTHFDTVLCVGPHHVDEIRRPRHAYGLPAKELVEHGSAKLDTRPGTRSVLRSDARARSTARPTVLVAPSWGECSLIERPVGIERVSTRSSRAGSATILRLHPMTVSSPARARRERYAGVREHDPLFALEEDMSAIESWLALRRDDQ